MKFTGEELIVMLVGVRLVMGTFPRTHEDMEMLIALESKLYARNIVAVMMEGEE